MRFSIRVQSTGTAMHLLHDKFLYSEELIPDFQVMVHIENHPFVQLGVAEHHTLDIYNQLFPVQLQLVPIVIKAFNPFTTINACMCH